MSVLLQKQIKDNSTDISQSLKDLVGWTDEQEKKEQRRDLRATRDVGSSAKVEAVKQQIAQARKPEPAPLSGEDASLNQAPIKRDKTGMSTYYSDWDRIDVEGMCEELDDTELENQRIERKTRIAENDRILDDLALQPDGDRKRTSDARPRVKVSVRMSGRRASPVDLALPRKEQANRYYAEGRYKDAVAEYSSAIDGLDKYEPPESQSNDKNVASHDANIVADSAGWETEALNLKCTLLANRGQALLKLEEWREVVVDCSEALRYDPMHEKAILRRGFALARLKRWSAAARDLEHAVASNPGDKKAAAELKMTRRMLEEQAKEARAHAKATICDPTRAPTIPTRRLAVRVQRSSGNGAGFLEEQDISDHPEPPKPKGRVGVSMVGEAESHVAKDDTIEPDSGVAGGMGSSSDVLPKPQKQPYVPRSVRMRGRQAAFGPTVLESCVPSGSSTATASHAMNFYTFEAQWARLRGRPRERAALLRRIGANALPALFRDSLDSELLASTLEALGAELSAAAADTDTIGFVGAVLGALPRTPRFDLSLQGLVAEERRACTDVITALAANGCAEAELDALRQVYTPSPPPAQLDEVSEHGLEETFATESAPAVVSPPASVTTAKVGAAGGSASEAFSLDDCD